MSKISNRSLVFLVTTLFVISFFAFRVEAQTWSPPVGAPPFSNVAPPIHEGIIGQAKYWNSVPSYSLGSLYNLVEGLISAFTVADGDGVAATQYCLIPDPQAFADSGYNFSTLPADACVSDWSQIAGTDGTDGTDGNLDDLYCAVSEQGDVVTIECPNQQAVTITPSEGSIPPGQSNGEILSWNSSINQWVNNSQTLRVLTDSAEVRLTARWSIRGFGNPSGVYSDIMGNGCDDDEIMKLELVSGPSGPAQQYIYDVQCSSGVKIDQDNDGDVSEISFNGVTTYANSPLVVLGGETFVLDIPFLSEEAQPLLRQLCYNVQTGQLVDCESAPDGDGSGIFYDNTPGGWETFTIPQGVTEITVRVCGASGGGGGGAAALATSSLLTYAPSALAGAGGGGAGADGDCIEEVLDIDAAGQRIVSYNLGQRGSAGQAGITQWRTSQVWLGDLEGNDNFFSQLSTNGGNGGPTSYSVLNNGNNIGGFSIGGGAGGQRGKADNESPGADYAGGFGGEGADNTNSIYHNGGTGQDESLGDVNDGTTQNEAIANLLGYASDIPTSHIWKGGRGGLSKYLIDEGQAPGIWALQYGCGVGGASGNPVGGIGCWNGPNTNDLKNPGGGGGGGAYGNVPPHTDYIACLSDGIIIASNNYNDCPNPLGNFSPFDGWESSGGAGHTGNHGWIQIIY